MTALAFARSGYGDLDENVLRLVPLVIAAAIAQQPATSGPGHHDPLPEISPVRIKQGSTPRSGDICIVHVTVIDTASGKENRDRVVTISGDRIAGIAAGSAMAPAGSCTVIDETGKYLIPGLWDMHAHGSQFDGVLPLYVANGVTGIREMSGPLPGASSFAASQRSTTTSPIFQAPSRDSKWGHRNLLPMTSHPNPAYSLR